MIGSMRMCCVQVETAVLETLMVLVQMFCEPFQCNRCLMIFCAAINAQIQPPKYDHA